MIKKLFIFYLIRLRPVYWRVWHKCIVCYYSALYHNYFYYSIVLSLNFRPLTLQTEPLYPPMHIYILYICIGSFKVEIAAGMADVSKVITPSQLIPYHPLSSLFVINILISYYLIIFLPPRIIILICSVPLLSSMSPY